MRNEPTKEPAPRLELGTARLRIECSTTELSRLTATNRNHLPSMLNLPTLNPVTERLNASDRYGIEPTTARTHRTPTGHLAPALYRSSRTTDAGQTAKQAPNRPTEPQRYRNREAWNIAVALERSRRVSSGSGQR